MISSTAKSSSRPESSADFSNPSGSPDARYGERTQITTQITTAPLLMSCLFYPFYASPSFHASKSGLNLSNATRTITVNTASIIPMKK